MCFRQTCLISPAILLPHVTGVDFLINVHNDAVKAMRYPDKKKEEEVEEEDGEDVPTIEEVIDELLSDDDDL